MTLTINATVTTIETNEDGDSIVQFSATAVEDVTLSYPDGKGGMTEYVQKQIFCNTEGHVLGAVITLIVEGSEPPVEMGQVVSFSGSFTRK